MLELITLWLNAYGIYFLIFAVGMGLFAYSMLPSREHDQAKLNEAFERNNNEEV